MQPVVRKKEEAITLQRNVETRKRLKGSLFPKSLDYCGVISIIDKK